MYMKISILYQNDHRLTILKKNLPFNINLNKILQVFNMKIIRDDVKIQKSMKH